ncbi:MAG: hypothetical protein AABW88_05235 [Nanoarchaeota archaeon]
MIKATNKFFVLIVVLAVILTSFLTWKVSEWQNEKINSQNAIGTTTYSNPNGNGGKVNINIVPPADTEVK